MRASIIAFELGHAKTRLKIFVGVIPFGVCCTLECTVELDSVAFTEYILSFATSQRAPKFGGMRTCGGLLVSGLPTLQMKFPT